MSRFPNPLSRPGLLGLLLVFGGCSQTFYHQAGKTALQRDRDLIQCEVTALRQAPVASQIRFTPPLLEQRKICDSKGNCLTESYWAGSEPYSVDPNEDLRRRLQLQCMDDKGYRQVSLPNCERGSEIRINATMPPLDRASCVARDNAGRLQVATAR